MATTAFIYYSGNEHGVEPRMPLNSDIGLYLHGDGFPENVLPLLIYIHALTHEFRSSINTNSFLVQLTTMFTLQQYNVVQTHNLNNSACLYSVYLDRDHGGHDYYYCVDNDGVHIMGETITHITTDDKDYYKLLIKGKNKALRLHNQYKKLIPKKALARATMLNITSEHADR